MGNQSDEPVWLVCPACKSRVAHRPGSGLAQTRCPGCGAAVGVLDETDVPTKFKSRGAIADEDFQPSADDDDEYKMSAWVEPVRPLADPVVPRPIAIKPEATVDPKAALRPTANAPPQWTFFSGVFAFPWRQRAIVPWIVISVGSMLFGVVAIVAVGGALSATAQGAIAAGAALMALIWIGLLTFSYAAASLFSVIDMTTYNFDLDEDWPDPDWRERFWPLVWVLWVLIVAAAPGIVLYFALGWTLAESWMLQVAIVAILFPLLLLSSLEADSIALPLSWPITRSLLSESPAWLTFYALTMSMLGCWLFATAKVFVESPYVAIVVSSPVFGALVLIYGRLAGRLAWKIMRPGELQQEAWRRSRDRQVSRDIPKA